jgi:hypothetical protein
VVVVVVGRSVQGWTSGFEAISVYSRVINIDLQRHLLCPFSSKRSVARDHQPVLGVHPSANVPRGYIALQAHIRAIRYRIYSSLLIYIVWPYTELMKFIRAGKV